MIPLTMSRQKQNFESSTVVRSSRVQVIDISGEPLPLSGIRRRIMIGIITARYEAEIVR
jgi:hypothetical protein